MKKSAFIFSFLFFIFTNYILLLSPVFAANACINTIREGCTSISTTFPFFISDDAKCNPSGACGSLYCDSVSGTCQDRGYDPNTPLQPPGDIQECGTTDTTICLQWKRIESAESYKIFQDGNEVKTVTSPTKSSTGSEAATAEKKDLEKIYAKPITVTIDKLTLGTKYQFYVQSCREGEPCSANSPTKEIESSGIKACAIAGKPCNGSGSLAQTCCGGLTCVGAFGGAGLCKRESGDPDADLAKSIPQISLGPKTGDTINIQVDSVTNPAGENVMKNIETYTVYYRKEGDTDFLTKSEKAPAIALTGLQNNSRYHIHVVGRNNKSSSENSNELDVTTSEAQGKIATSCTIADCNGTICSKLNPKANGGSYCNITSKKGDPLSCSCGPPPPPPPPPCTDVDANGLCKSIPTSLGFSIETTPVGFAKVLFGIALSISGGIAVLLLITAGYQIMTSSGDPEKIQGAKDTITSTIIGLVFMMFSLVVLQIIGVDILHIPGLTK